MRARWTIATGAVRMVGLAVVCAPLFIVSPAASQSHPGPLTIEGLNARLDASADVRAFGGVTIGAQNSLSSMFVHPATLFSLEGPQISIAGAHRDLSLRQEQHFAPVRYYPNLSLLLEGLTDQIPDPDPTLIGFTPADSVQRTLDDIQPNWSRDDAQSLPLHAMVAVPFSAAGVRLVAGAGYVRYADLHHYDQNNNVMEPGVLAVRPLPILRPTDNNPLEVDWQQSIRSREGMIHGYGGALAGHVEQIGLTLGISGLLLNGSSDDFERLEDRGRLTFFANEFRVQPSSKRHTRRGTSDFSGFELTLSGLLSSEFVSIGLALHAPTTITREFATQVEIDTAGTTMTSRISGEDELRLPWRGSVGLLLRPRPQLHLGLQYEWRPFGRATYTDVDGVESTPWESASVFAVGAQYTPASWVVVRAGLRREADVFVPDGSPMDIEPVTYRVYSVGLGLRYQGIRWSVAYEMARMSYQDIWSSAFSDNEHRIHRIATDLSYTLPW